MLKKRSVSPLIATILLIVVSVILITVVLTWGSGFAKDNLNKATSTVDFKESDLSSQISVVSYDHLEDKSNVLIKNSSTERLRLIGYKIISENLINPEYIFSFPNIVNIEPDGFGNLNIICFPKNTFVLELITEKLEYIPLSITIKNYVPSYCSVFSDFLGYWSFEGSFNDSSENNLSNIYYSGEFLGDFKNQYLSLNGSTDSLVVDNKTKVSLVDYTTWQVGTQGSQIGFNKNGDTSENKIILDRDPWGREVPVWLAIPDSISGADGGWGTDQFPIDNTKLYRFSVWLNREVLGENGRFYLGVYGFNSLNSLNGVYNLSNTLSTNPYFVVYYLPLIYEGNWVLVVCHVFPYDYSLASKHIDSGIYNLEKTKLYNSGADFKWSVENYFALHRSYLFYCTDTTVRQKWVYPRVDVIDGTEPSIEDLLSGYDSNNFGITESISLSGWIKVNSFNDGAIIWKTKNSISDICYGLSINSEGYIQFNIDQSELISNVPITIDDWVFVSATYDKAKMKLFINGELESELEKTTPIKVSKQETTIGVKKHNEIYDCYYSGNLDDVRIYQKALKESDILNLYISTKPDRLGE